MIRESVAEIYEAVLYRQAYSCVWLIQLRSTPRDSRNGVCIRYMRLWVLWLIEGGLKMCSLTWYLLCIKCDRRCCSDTSHCIVNAGLYLSLCSWCTVKSSAAWAHSTWFEKWSVLEADPILQHMRVCVDHWMVVNRILFGMCNAWWLRFIGDSMSMNTRQVCSVRDITLPHEWQCCGVECWLREMEYTSDIHDCELCGIDNVRIADMIPSWNTKCERILLYHIVLRVYRAI